MPGGCEQNYIDCLAGGSTADACQPLLDACMPAAGSSTGCDPLEPGCSGGEESSVTTDGPGCDADGSCDPDESDCELRYQLCQETLGEPDLSTCEELRNACETEDCESALSICSRVLEAQDSCEELTGCVDTPTRPSCDDLLNVCAEKGVSPTQCGQMFPDSPRCFPNEPGNCQWYEQECQATFDPSFCSDGQPACEAGWLPEVFECGLFFPNICDQAGLGDAACEQAEASCMGGFFDAMNCAATPLYKNPYTWLMELAECNGWM